MFKYDKMKNETAKQVIAPCQSCLSNPSSLKKLFSSGCQPYQYMKEIGLFTSDQSCSLLKMSDDWYNWLYLSKFVGLVSIDLLIGSINDKKAYIALIR